MQEITQFLLDAGVDKQELILLLMLPIVTTIISFGRHFIGIKAMGIYTPIILTFAFYLLGIRSDAQGTDLLLGIKLGFVLTLIVFIIASAIHIITKRIRLHYLPKMAIVLTTVAATLFGIIYAGVKLELTGLTRIDPIALVLITITAEQFISYVIRKSFSTATLLGFETLILTTISYAVIAWPSFQNLVLEYPVISVGMILLNFLIGKFTGLRVREYFRFSDILSGNEPSNDIKE